MKVRLFKASDLHSVNKWRMKRNLWPVPGSELPRLGYMIPGVAAAFLRRVEGGYALMDSLVTNPHVSSNTRHKALESLYDIILQEPSIKGIIGFTVDESTLMRAKARGFKQLQHTVLTYTKE